MKDDQLPTFGTKSALKPSCANSILVESPVAWVPNKVIISRMTGYCEHHKKICFSVSTVDNFTCIPSIAMIFSSSVFWISFNTEKSSTLNTCVLSGSDAIVFNSSSASLMLKALPT